MPDLALYDEYDRETVHNIFEPEVPFVRGAGTWGIRGIIPLKNYPGDFVLFVTFGKLEGDHLFDESVSSEGILRWQSEPQQTLTSQRVVELLHHDERVNTVHLFLRTSGLHGGVATPFSYLGPLKYLNHDAERERPAHVAWQLLEWPIPSEVAVGMRLNVVQEVSFQPSNSTQPLPLVNSLEEEEPPSSTTPPGEPTHSFKAQKRRYLSSEESRDLGLRGERLVLDRERTRLKEAGRGDLADQVMHTSVVQGDGAGYDIGSFFSDGRPKYIEVKTTTGPKTADFLISRNEIAFSAQESTHYELCRVFGYDGARNAAKCFSLWGDVSKILHLTETQYRARIVSGKMKKVL